MDNQFQTFFVRFTTDKFKAFAIRARNAEDACIRLMLRYPEKWRGQTGFTSIEISSEINDAPKKVKCFALESRAERLLKQQTHRVSKKLERKANSILPGYESLIR